MYAPHPRDRIVSGVAALAVVALLGWALMVGLATGWTRLAAQESLAVFTIAPPPPPPREQRRPERQRRAAPREEGRAAPPALTSRAAPVAAPRPIVIVPVPPSPIIVAVKPFAGDQPTQGAAPTPGPGTGAGGVGDGTGSGGWGDGDGGGGGAETPPRWRRGRLKDSDYPGDAGENGFEGTVGVKYLVATDGRVPACEVTRSSGNRELDQTTCRLIRERFRFSPSRDARGRAVPSYIVENHSWVIEREPPDIAGPP